VAAWLVLVYQLPARKSPARVKAWRRLQRVGAVPLKNSVYVLPDSADAREDFEWIKGEILAIGGEAMILVADAPDDRSSAEITNSFRAARERDFGEIAKEAESLRRRWTARPTRGTRRRRLVQTLRRLRERFREIEKIDYFEASGRQRAACLLDEFDHSVRETIMTPTTTLGGTLEAKQYRGRVWMTRPRPGVDRMASAWLIRRFIDPDARFAFGDRVARKSAIGFDMFGVEFGHHGDACTFEVIAQRFRIDDPAVARIGHIVHALDLKEDASPAPETAAVGRIVDGLRELHHEDDRLLAEGMAMFEALYRSFRSERQTRASRADARGRAMRPTRRRRS
jgi:hypothetical protein